MADGFHVKTSVEIFPDRIEALTNTPHGPVGVHIRSTAQEMLQLAASKVGTHYSGTTGKVTDNRSGRIKDSGKVVSTGGASVAVVFDHPIAYLHHEGSRSHIYDKNQWYINKNSPSTRHGGTFRRHGFIPFQHPGTAGNPFLRNAAIDMGLKPSGSLLRGNRPTSLFRLRSL